MKRLRLLVLLVSLLIFWGFGGSSLLPFLGNGVDFDELEYRGDIVRGDIRYLKGSDTPYTGKATSRYKKGKHMARKRKKGNYKNGKPHGLFVEWRSNGTKMYEENYKDGKKDGLEVVYFFRSQLSRFLKPWSNGQKKEEINYKGGKKNGLETQWYENGQKKIETNYKDGRKVGLQAVWYSNGEKWP